MKTLSAIVLSAVIGLSACTGIKKVSYNPPKAADSSLILSEKTDAKTTFQVATNDLVKSGVFSPAFIEQLTGLEYYITGRKKDFRGQYYETNPAILLYIKNPPIEGQYLEKLEVESTIAHEGMHHYFSTNLTKHEQDEFRKKITSYTQAFDIISDQQEKTNLLLKSFLRNMVSARKHIAALGY